jgi:arginyl-tRNA synthetase
MGGGELDNVAIRFTEDAEVEIGKKVLEFPEVVERVTRNYRPNILTDYLFDLSSLYNRFYQNIPFLKAPEGIRESRLVLCGLVGRIIQKGLDLLGIEVPDRM